VGVLLQAPYADKDCQGIFNTHAFFVGSNLRKAVAEGKKAAGSNAFGERLRRDMIAFRPESVVSS
jgi:hypothetical protein